MKISNPKSWSFAQQVTATIASFLTVCAILGSWTLSFADGRYVIEADHQRQAESISNRVSVEQYSYWREVLIQNRVGASLEKKEQIDAQIKIIDGRINNLKSK